MNNKTVDLVKIGVFAAIIFVATMYLRISITLPSGEPTMFKTANIICVLAGLMLGKVNGGFAAGIGSALFDLMNPLYISSTPYTFVFFFLMAFFAGLVYEKTQNVALSASVGAYGYVVMYFVKKVIETLLETHGFAMYTFDEIKIAMVARYMTLGVSMINATFAVIVASIIYPEIKKRVR